MGSAPSKKSIVRVIKEQPATSELPYRAWEQEEDSSPIAAVTHEELVERLAVSQEKAREAESRASEANDKVYYFARYFVHVSLCVCVCFVLSVLVQSSQSNLQWNSFPSKESLMRS